MFAARFIVNTSLNRGSLADEDHAGMDGDKRKSPGFHKADLWRAIVCVALGARVRLGSDMES
jgi:hypothetical protein